MTPVAGAQESVVQGLLSLTTGGVPAVQVPLALHVSAPLQALPSLQDVPFGFGEQVPTKPASVQEEH